MNEPRRQNLLNEPRRQNLLNEPRRQNLLNEQRNLLNEPRRQNLLNEPRRQNLLNETRRHDRLSYIPSDSRLYKEKSLTALGAQQRGLQFLRPQYPIEVACRTATWRDT